MNIQPQRKRNKNLAKYLQKNFENFWYNNNNKQKHLYRKFENFINTNRKYEERYKNNEQEKFAQYVQKI